MLNSQSPHLPWYQALLQCHTATVSEHVINIHAINCSNNHCISGKDSCINILTSLMLHEKIILVKRQTSRVFFAMMIHCIDVVLLLAFWSLDTCFVITWGYRDLYLDKNIHITVKGINFTRLTLILLGIKLSETKKKKRFRCIVIQRFIKFDLFAW